MKTISFLVFLLYCCRPSFQRPQQLDDYEYEEDSNETTLNQVDIDGETFFQVDDMLLDSDQVNFYYGDGSSGRSGIAGERYRWPNRELPYEVSGGIPSRQRRILDNAITTLNNVLGGCLRIRPATSSDQSRVVFRSGSGCSSFVGRRGRSQNINLAVNGCFFPRIIMHEIIHAIGFDHEQSRPDRDNYIRIVESNIPRGARSQFAKAKNSLTFNVPYDYKSIMHYKYNNFAINRNRPTIESIRPEVVPTKMIIPSQTPTKNDILKIRRMYNCGDGDDGDDNGDYTGDDYYDQDDKTSQYDYNEDDYILDDSEQLVQGQVDDYDPSFADGVYTDLTKAYQDY